MIDDRKTSFQATWCPICGWNDPHGIHPKVIKYEKEKKDESRTDSR